MTPPIVFLTDYGLADEFVGTCHGVIARIAPGVRVIDLSHAVRPHDVLGGAVLLAQSLRYMPDDSIYLAVVDPGVGTSRRQVVVQAKDGTLFVGPDNGLLGLALEELGGAKRAVEITSDRVLQQPVSMSFHGRDVFAPAAAHLAIGLAMEEIGPDVQVDSLAGLSLPKAEASAGEIRCQILAVDRFGNAQLPIRPGDLEEAGLGELAELEVETVQGAFIVQRAGTFADVGEGDLAMFVDSRGWLALAVYQGSAAESLGLEAGEPLFLRKPSGLG